MAITAGLQNLTTILQTCPSESAIDWSVKFSIDTMPQPKWIQLFNDQAALIVPVLSRTLFAFYIIPRLTTPAACYNGSIGVTYLFIACIKIFQGPNQDETVRNPVEKHRKLVEEQLSSAIIYLSTAVYDYVIGFALNGSLGIFAAAAFGLLPGTVKEFHKSFFNKVSAVTQNPKEKATRPPIFDQLDTCKIAEFASVCVAQVRKGINEKSTPKEPDSNETVVAEPNPVGNTLENRQ